MTKKEKFNAIINAYEVKHRDCDNKDIQVISKKIPKEVHDELLKIQRNLNVGFELSYEIVSDACYEIGDRLIIDDTAEKDEDIINIEDITEHDGINCASCYTSVQLEYIDNNNQSEISDIAKDYETDVAAAAAIWYNEKVLDACRFIIDYINK